MNCLHCKVHLLVSKTIKLKYTENTCCVDIVWHGENQNKTNEEHPWCEQFTNNADTLCHKPLWICFHGNVINKMLLKLMNYVVNSLVAQVFGAAPHAPAYCRKFNRDTCFLQNISFRRYSHHLWVRWKTHGRKRDHAYSKNLEENVLRDNRLAANWEVVCVARSSFLLELLHFGVLDTDDICSACVGILLEHLSGFIFWKYLTDTKL